jgi:hypothetical protein
MRGARYMRLIPWTLQSGSEQVGYSSWSSLAGRTGLSMPQVQLIMALTTIAYYSFSIPGSAVAQPGQRNLSGLPEWAPATEVRDFQPLAFIYSWINPIRPLSHILKYFRIRFQSHEDFRIRKLLPGVWNTAVICLEGSDTPLARSWLRRTMSKSFDKRILVQNCFCM